MRPVVHSLAALTAIFIASAAPADEATDCGFDITTLSFAGTPREQARCLLRQVGKYGQLGSRLASLPPTLARLVGRPAHLDPLRLRAALAGRGIALDGFDRPVSRARDGDPAAPLARYFVIHDTSEPYLGDQPFPADIDSSPTMNDVDRFLGPDAVAHAFVDRLGKVQFGHDFAVPWRATKLESRIVGLPAKGLFLHIENVQPRRRDPVGDPGNDAIAPLPGLTDAQYDRLASLYAYASHRAGQWLVPAFHATVDAGIPDAHDDPQNFDLRKFDAALAAVLKEAGNPR